MKIINKYKNLSVQAKATLWFIACSILQKGISLITVPIFTRILSAEEYGTYSLYASWLQILTIFTSLYLYYGIFNNALVKFGKKIDKYISSMQGLTNTITIIVFIIYIIWRDTWNQLTGLNTTITLLIFAEMFVAPAISFWAARQRFEYRYKKMVCVTLIQSIANPILGLILVSISNDKATARVFSIVLLELIFCGTIMIRQYLKGKTFFDKEYWKYALKLAIPLLPHYLSGMILNQGDRVVISHLVGKNEVAFYSVAYNLGMLIQIFTNAINNAFTPWIYQNMKKNNYSEIKSTTNVLLIIIATIAICLMVCSPEVIAIFGSEDYASAVYVIPPAAASVFFIYLYNLLAIPQFYFEKTRYLLISSIFAAVLNIILNYIFIPIYGYIAAGYTTLVCYVVYCIGHFIISKRIIKKATNNENIYDKNMITLLSLIIIAIAIVSNFLFDLIVLRYIILVCGVIVIYTKRSTIFKIFKKNPNKEEKV